MAYKKYRRSRRYGNKTKYSVEQTSFSGAVGSAEQSALVVVPPTGLQGMRKVKHLTISLSTRGLANNVAAEGYPFYYALVYVPQGTSPNQLNITQTVGSETGAESTSFTVANLYNPNQFVMSCGFIDPSAGPIRISSPLARNLNSGDYIALLIQVPQGPGNVTGFGVSGLVQYAIALN